ncbi:phytanoyl-CoA dioxygenase [Ascobolus immersus RN42]|uniref:Phytanoyl-CoA dioxygenase n=1 Tax=Ascobolus immersus RN42 TaxID=1160509 RepID=A0A3N4I328_ASCIM|nr:phytanoyl-CoA dioxygenase [Ascobolus immersus RN42]
MSIQGLTPAQVEQFNADGFLVLPDELTPEQVSLLLERTNKLLDEFPLENHPLTAFTTSDKAHIGDEYFLTSANKVHFFFEEHAFGTVTNPDGTETRGLTRPKQKAINKIGHALHIHDPLFRAVSLSPRNKLIAQSLAVKDPRILQSMIICKQPEIGGEVPSHQDSTFLYTDPPSAVGFWYALEDTDTGNGCLSFQKGSHKTAPITKRFVRKDLNKGDQSGTTFEDLPEGKGNGLSGEAKESDGEWIMGEVKKGSLVLIHGNLLHKSAPNLSQRSRFIYTFHAISGAYEYDQKNWLQPTPEAWEQSKLEEVPLPVE